MKPRSDEEVAGLVEKNMRLARYMANSWARAIGEQEAFSAAMEGLLHACRNHDPENEVPFGTYASLRIRYALLRVYHDQRRVKRGGRALIFSLDAPINGEGSPTFSDRLRDESPTVDEVREREDTSASLDEMMGTLSDREREVLRRRFGLGGDEPEILEAMAGDWGITRERVRQIQEKALDKLCLLFAKRNVTPDQAWSVVTEALERRRRNKEWCRNNEARLKIATPRHVRQKLYRQRWAARNRERLNEGARVAYRTRRAA